MEIVYTESTQVQDANLANFFGQQKKLSKLVFCSNILVSKLPKCPSCRVTDWFSGPEDVRISVFHPYEGRLPKKK